MRRLLRRDPRQRFYSRSVLATLLIDAREFHEERLIQPPKFLATILGPILVSVCGQQLPGIQVQRRPVGCGIALAAGGRRCLFESLDIHPKRPCGTQCDPAFLGCQVSGAHSRVECFACGVEYPAQVVRGCLRPEIWPECVHDLLAVEVVSGRQGEQLDQAPGLPQVPLVLSYNSWANPHAKATEQLDAYDLNFPSGIPTGAARCGAAVLMLLRAPAHPLPPYIC